MSISPVTIIDYGMGNIGSIANMLRRAGASVELAQCSGDIFKARRLILPGVGAFDEGMRAIQRSGMRESLDSVRKVTPILGICLGMQLMTQSSEEGQSPGLGWINASTLRFRSRIGEKIRVPHMGWSRINLRRESSFLSKGVPVMQRGYYAHSYHVACENVEDVMATSTHGVPFAAAFAVDNLVGVQFHPEKSHRHGLEFILHWLKWCG